MADYAKSIGQGGGWVKDLKSGKGKYLTWSITFPVSGNVPIVVSGVAFKNEKKEGNQPDYRFLVNKWEYPKAKEPAKPAPQSAREEDSDLPF